MTENNRISLGPWRFNRTYRLRDIPIDRDRECVEFVNASGRPIGCWVPYDWDGTCPDSSLIAGATDLLEAAKRLLAAQAKIHDSWKSSGMLEAAAELQAAIAKAEGEAT